MTSRDPYRSKSNTAFTLVEMLVAMAATSLLIVLLVNIISLASDSWQRGDALAESSSNVRGVMTLLNKEFQGMAIDLDLGFRIVPKSSEQNNFELKFLTRRRPINNEPGVEKVCYQLAWASREITPTFSTTRDGAHPVPVLVRTTSSDLSDVFNVSAPGKVDEWSRLWPNLTSPAPGDVTEVLADNILGWKIEPLSWNQSTGAMEVATSSEPSNKFDTYLTSPNAPDALRIGIALIPARAVPRLEAGYSQELTKTRNFADLFDVSKWPDTPFYSLLRQSLQVPETTIFLQSKTK